MTPYVDEVNETLEVYFIQRGIELTHRAAFKQDGDPQMNQIDPECLLEEAGKLGSGDCDDRLRSQPICRLSPRKKALYLACHRVCHVPKSP